MAGLVVAGLDVVGLFVLNEVDFTEGEAVVATCTFGFEVDAWPVLFAALELEVGTLELEDLMTVLELSEPKWIEDDEDMVRNEEIARDDD